MYKRLHLTRLILIPSLICLFSFALVLPMGVTETAAQGGIEPIPTEPIYEIPDEVLNQNRETWNGYTDGRVDPRLDDAYNIYCTGDQLNIWGGKPEPRLITSFPLRDVLSLSPNLGLLSQDGVLLQRTENQILVQGTNGNTTPQFGSKGFLLDDCLAANGGIPEDYAPPPPPAPPAPPVDYNAPSTNPGQTIIDFNNCLQRDPSNSLADCLRVSVDDEYSGGIQILWGWLLRFCVSPFALVFAIPVLRLRRKRRKSPPSASEL